MSARDAGFVATGYSASWYVYTVYMLSFLVTLTFQLNLAGIMGKRDGRETYSKVQKPGKSLRGCWGWGLWGCWILVPTEPVVCSERRVVVVLCSVSVARGGGVDGVKAIFRHLNSSFPHPRLSVSSQLTAVCSAAATESTLSPNESMIISFGNDLRTGRMICKIEIHFLAHLIWERKT